MRMIEPDQFAAKLARPPFGFMAELAGDPTRTINSGWHSSITNR